MLLVKAVEETDRGGELVPVADRAAATREALRAEPGLAAAFEGSGAAPARAAALARFVERRAAVLLDRLAPRHPVLGHVVDRAGVAPWAGRLVLVAAFATGLALSSLDGSRRIDVLAYPLAGVVLWNLAVYVALAVAALRRRPRREPLLGRLELGAARRAFAGLLDRTSFFSTTLAEALKQYGHELAGAAGPYVAVRARRLLHLAAALTALGLVAGLYVRGVWLEYRAGWESTFLGPEAVGRALGWLYGPASVLSGIALPRTPAELEALRWTAGGAPAARWIHLAALTAVLAVVLPRLALAVVETLRLARLERTAALPSSVTPYARELLADAGLATGETVGIAFYGGEPAGPAARGLERLVEAAFGRGSRLVARAPVRYGEEEALQAAVTAGDAARADFEVLVVNLAATPERENHGAAIATLRDGLARAGRGRLVVVADGGPYAARMSGEGLAARLAERTESWRRFVAEYGVGFAAADLAAIARDGAAPAPAAEALRQAATGPAR